MKRTRTLTNLRHILVAVAIVLLANSSGAAQTLSRDRVQLALTSHVCQPSKEVSCGADLRAVTQALGSPSKLWAFVTASETGYFERVAAASSAGKLMPATWIPTILSANRELAREAHIHAFGVQRYPLDQAGPYFQKTPRDRLGLQVRRTILGHAFIVPDEWMDYPLSDAELHRSPWPFQVSQALNVLYSAMVTDGDPAQIDSVAFQLPCGDKETAEMFVTLTWNVATKRHFIADEVFGAWLNILRNPKTQTSALGFVEILDQASRISQEKAEALGLEALQKQFDDAVGRSAYFQRQPYALLLASSRLVLSSDFRKRHSVEDQANDANLLRYAWDHTKPIPANLGPDEAANQRVVDDFAVWFKQNEAALERFALMERSAIDQAYREMSTVTTCGSKEFLAVKP